MVRMRSRVQSPIWAPQEKNMDIEFLSLSEAIDSFNWITAIIMFVFYVFVEGLDSSLHFSLNKYQELKTGIITFILYLSIAVEIALVITNYLYIIPAALGGTFAAVMIVRKEKKENEQDSQKQGVDK